MEKTIIKTLTSIVLAGALALGSVGCSRNNGEMEKYGYRHLSDTKIEYANGYEAKGFDDNGDGNIDRIMVTAYLVGDDIKAPLQKIEYKP